MIMGGNPFTSVPTWYINNEPVKTEETIKYLGTHFGYLNGNSHCNSRCNATTRAFYSLQSARIKYSDIDSSAVTDIYKATVQSVSLYGCSSIYINKGNMTKLNKLQSKLIKKCFRLSNWCRSRPLLEALYTISIPSSICLGNLELLKDCLLSDSLSCDLYLELFTSITSPSKSKTLLGRSMSYAHDFQFDLTRYIFCSLYYQDIKRQIRNTKTSGLDGLVDTIRSLLINKNSDDFRYIDLLLRSF